ncbi:MAG: TRAP transporter small permease [Alphaproteobacteria bacterium]|nr:TRAP transporter small permease [Alphaproteobacteria bacterium]
MMTSLARAHTALVTGLGYAAGIALAALALGITADVFLRNLGIANFAWLLEVSEYVLFISTFLAAPWVLRENAHVSVDLLLTGLAPALRKILNAVANLIGIGICATLTWYALRVTRDSIERGDMIFKELVVPEWPFLAVVAVTGALLVAEFVRRLFHPAHGSE